MSGETVIALIRDLTSTLSAVAEEFNEKANRFVAAEHVRASGAIDDETLVRLVETLIEQRKLRRSYLPDELFHEPAWDMLLALFVAHRRNHTMNIKTLVATSDAPVTTSQRWIEHLHKLGLINRVIDPADRRRVEISLNDAGESAMVRYLRHVAGRRAG